MSQPILAAVNTTSSFTQAGSTLNPREIVAELDRFIIGQDQAKKAVAIALRNRWRRKQVDESLRDEIVRTKAGEAG